MKICSPQLGISPHSSLGGEIYDHQTLKGFCQKGIDVFVYLPKNRPYDKSLKKLHVEYCFMAHIFPPWIYSFICLPYLFKTYKKEKFEVLRIHSPRFLGIAGLIFHVFHPEVFILASAVTVDDSFIFFPIEKMLFGISKRIIVQSNYIKKRLIKRFNIPDDKIVITYGGSMDSSTKWTQIPDEAKNLSKGDIVLLYMGLLIKRKNPIFLAEVFRQSKNLVPNLKLVIIGSGPEKKPLIKTLRQAGLLEDTIFINSAYGSQKAYWLSRMDIFLFPSKEEAFGLSVTEAMSFAKPVIASNIGAFQEIITTGLDGYTLQLELAVWAKTIINLLKSPALSKKIGTSAQKTVKEKFNWERTYNLNYEVVKKIIL